ncbi:hypothetical protein BJ878DRAFT_324195 [Calycina marina]|uniref:Uncharacterized protein n=1 Tax=Calycina marina TaxID=1763456 RepID=A0A9P7YU48_9HELO|nr:hypothetical protein BJ878DRAFT_324195 [Calycina marina]
MAKRKLDETSGQDCCMEHQGPEGFIKVSVAAVDVDPTTTQSSDLQDQTAESTKPEFNTNIIDKVMENVVYNGNSFLDTYREPFVNKNNEQEFTSACSLDPDEYQNTDEVENDFFDNYHAMDLEKEEDIEIFSTYSDSGDNDDNDLDKARIQVWTCEGEEYQGCSESASDSSSDGVDFDDIDLQKIYDLEQRYVIDEDKAGSSATQSSSNHSGHDTLQSGVSGNGIPGLTRHLGVNTSMNEPIAIGRHMLSGSNVAIPPQEIHVRWADILADGPLRINGRVVTRAYAEETQTEILVLGQYHVRELTSLRPLGLPIRMTRGGLSTMETMMVT